MAFRIPIFPLFICPGTDLTQLFSLTGSLNARLVDKSFLFTHSPPTLSVLITVSCTVPDCLNWFGMARQKIRLFEHSKAGMRNLRNSNIIN
jgi:hypothetical protein